MHFSTHRRRRAAAPHTPVLLTVLAALTAAGCTSTDEPATATVPTPDKATTALCRHLDHRLPRHVDGLRRADPTPRSALTAGWGDPAIVLRCGVHRPARMDDPDADAVEVDGVGWLSEKRADGSFRFTTTLRKAYVEVSLPEQRTARGLAPLTDLAPAVRHSIPHGIAG